LLHLLLKNGDFLNIDISQGSVATRLGCGGVFVYDFVINFLLSLTVKEFWKSVNIWWSYGQELGVLFFLTHSVNLFKTQSHRSEKARRAQLQSAQRCVYARTIRGFFSRIAGKEEKNILSLYVSVAGSPGPRAYWIRRTLRETRSIATHLFLSGLHSGTVVARRDGRNIDENTAIKPR